MTAATQQRMTVEEFARYAADRGPCELIDGEVRHSSPAGSRHGHLTGRLHAFLGWHVIQNHLGAVFAAETGFRLSRPGGPATVRGADIAFLSRDRLPSADDPGFLTVPPDLVVETVSPSDRASALAEKVGWWLTHGARLVWVLDPQNRLVTTHHPDGVARVYRQNDTLQAEEVVPGFSLPLADLFVSGG